MTVSIIRMSGDRQSGKTATLVEIANSRINRGQTVLFVCPLQRDAKWLRTTCRLHPNVVCISALEFIQDCSVRKQVVIFDNLDHFPESKEGDYVRIAIKYLSIWQPHNFPTLVYSSDRLPLKKWNSTVTWWKPWTWGTGYWNNYN